MEMYLKTISRDRRRGQRTRASRPMADRPRRSDAVVNVPWRRSQHCGVCGFLTHDRYGDVQLTTRGKRVRARRSKIATTSSTNFCWKRRVLPAATVVARTPAARARLWAPKDARAPGVVPRVPPRLQPRSQRDYRDFGNWLDCAEKGEACHTCAESGGVRVVPRSRHGHAPHLARPRTVEHSLASRRPLGLSGRSDTSVEVIAASVFSWLLVSRS